jgi:hypothetical protein
MRGDGVVKQRPFCDTAPHGQPEGFRTNTGVPIALIEMRV